MLLTEQRGLVRRLLDVFASRSDKPVTFEDSGDVRDAHGFRFLGREPTRVVGFDQTSETPRKRDVSF